MEVFTQQQPAAKVRIYSHMLGLREVCLLRNVPIEHNNREYHDDADMDMTTKDYSEDDRR